MSIASLDKHETLPGRKQKQYLNKRDVANRYRTTPRNVERKVKQRILPPPVYLLGSKVPLWDLDVLDENDRAKAGVAA
jgi:hypothetical protein